MTPPLPVIPSTSLIETLSRAEQDWNAAALVPGTFEPRVASLLARGDGAETGTPIDAATVRDRQWEGGGRPAPTDANRSRVSLACRWAFNLLLR